MDKVKIGLIGVVGKEAERDYWGTMQKVAEIGYQGIEGAGRLLEGDVAANLKRFHALGLRVIAIGADGEKLRDQLDAVIADAKALQAPYVMVYWAPCETRDAWLRDAELFNQAGGRLAKEGVKLCYHNHEYEFKRTFNGVYALDVLAEYTDPNCLYFELDIAWATFGGADPVAVLQRMAGRVPAIHVKDLYALGTRGQFTAAGTGVVKVKEAVQTAIETGVEWAVVEQDALRNLTAFETVTASYLNLKEAGLV